MNRKKTLVAVCSILLAPAVAGTVPPRIREEGRETDPEEVIRRAEGCSYLSEQDIKTIIAEYNNWRQTKHHKSYSTQR